MMTVVFGGKDYEVVRKSLEEGFNGSKLRSLMPGFDDVDSFKPTGVRKDTNTVSCSSSESPPV